MADHFTEIQLPQQRNYNSSLFPSLLSPNPLTTTTTKAAAVPCSVSDLIETIKSQKLFLESLLHKTGAVLFRGFDVKTAEDFNDVIEAFGYEDFPSLGGTALRTQVFGRVFTANESPPDQKIGFHHEMVQALQFPSKLFFFCEVEPASGGETPIVLSHIVYERMRQNYPEFVDKLEEHGLILSRFLGEDDDPSSPIGSSWKSTFSTDDKSVAEERAAKQGNKLEWMERGGVKRIIGPIPAIRYDESRQRKIWFTSVVGWENAGNDPVNRITFGDGTPLPSDICYECLKILEEECAAIPWRKGDVLLIDNLAVLHARRPSKPPRRILASLCK
ncbi:hypothetical protein LWI28_008527 [Acer negundo]|uniref:TauD/TfdA-like domain-containing protein n=1 Tax=Acer negundo TaxID=4023 RepID=A0AAD5NIY7_ACENE|nr:hypothetical protein LWI28_008527 [Acer negundo]KAK4838718.1 hypothetical protein QYF36_015883 [Acer negundo]